MNVVEILVKGRDDPTVKKSYDQAAKGAKNLGTESKKAAGPGGLGLLKVAGAALVGGGLIDFFKQANDEARESQKVNAQTAAVLKSTGGAAHVTAKQIGDLATSISNKVGIDDEEIQSTENMLLTFTNVRNEVGKGNDVFNQATQIATDMSVALGQDAKNSAIQLGKALNDPIKGITALQRVGVTFTDQQKKQIKTLVESGHTLEAQKVILKELSKEFGGSAAAQATAGDKAKTAWKNFEEAVGTAVLPVLDKLLNFGSTRLLPWLQNVITYVQANADTWKGYLMPAWQTGVQVAKDVVAAGKGIIGWLQDHTTVAKAAAGGIAGFFAAYKTYKIIDNATKSIKALNLAMKANPVLTIVGALVALGVALVTAYNSSERFRNDVQNTFHYVKTAALDLGIAFIKFLLIPVLDVFSGIVHGAAAAFGWVPGIGGKLKAARAAFDNFRKGADRALHGMQAQLNTENAKFKAQQLQRTINGLHGKTLKISVTDNAKQQVAKVNAALAALRNKQISLTTYIQDVILPTAQASRRSASRTRGDAAGGVFTDRHYAAGGAYSQAGYGSTYMNEHGGEVVRLPNGSMIYSHPDAERMMGAGGQPINITFEVASSGSAFDKFMLEWIRRNVRIKGGGNVQVAFGKGA